MVVNEQIGIPFIPSTDIVRIIENAPSLPDALNYRAITSKGQISRGNASYVLKALQYLGLTNREGWQTPTLQSLAQAYITDTQEYKILLRKLLQEKYPNVFEKIGPESVGKNILQISRAELNNTFPEGKHRTRMAALFVGLARQADWEIMVDQNNSVVPQTTMSFAEAESKATFTSVHEVHTNARTLDKTPLKSVMTDMLDSLELLRQVGEDANWTEKQKTLWSQIHRINIKNTKQIYEMLE